MARRTPARLSGVRKALSNGTALAARLNRSSLLAELDVDQEGPEPRLMVRESRRARQLALNFVPPHKLELVVPRGTPLAAIKAFVSSHRAWIERVRLDIESRYRADRNARPTDVFFAAIEQRWRLRYGAFERVRVERRASATEPGVLAVPDAPQGVARGLQAWLRARGRDALVPWLELHAARTGLAPRSVQVRLQHTRWGSCSARGCVSLNASALFLQPPVVDYLIVHELCHLRHLNHSRRFWRLVEQHLPEYESLNRSLAQAWENVPVWALSDQDG
jgi:predicted metal-dependent hydrolase